jgi:pimeloyl-ACP methyl ester carboxylesterase
MENEFITLNSGLKIHYKEFGRRPGMVFDPEGECPTLLLIHGWNNDWSGFMPLIEHLEDKFHVVAVDLPGYGKSEALKEDYSVEKLSDILSEFINKKKGGNIDVLCALSMGTVIAADLSNRHSKMIKSVVLIGPPIIKYDWLPSKIFREWMKVMNKSSILMSTGHKALASNWYGHFTAKRINMYKYDRELINKHGMKGRKKINSRALFQMGKAMYHFHLEKTLKEIKIPMLIILGRHDKVVDLKTAIKVGHDRENVIIEWVEEAGHVVSLEKPIQTSNLVKEFAKNLKIL